MKIGVSSILSTRSPSVGTTRLKSSQLSIQRADDSEAVKRDNSSSRVSAGTTLQASQATSAARIASSAASSILDARKSQQSLIEKATISNDPAKRAELQSAIDELDTEIARIKTEATDATGDNVLEGKTFDITDSESVALADLSSIADSSGVDVTTVSGAEAAESSISTIINNAVSGVESSSSVTRKAEIVLSEETSVEAVQRQERGAVTEEDEATQLSQRIATELESTLSSASASNLDAENVLQLISE